MSWRDAPLVATGWQSAPSREDPNAGVVSDLPGGGWNQQAAELGSITPSELRMSRGVLPGMRAPSAGDIGTLVGSSVAGGFGAGAMAANPVGTALGTLGAMGGSKLGKSVGAEWGLPPWVGGAIGGLAGALAPGAISSRSAALKALMGMLTPAAEGTVASTAAGAGVADLPAAVAAAKAAAQAEVLAGGAPGAAAGVRAAWNMGPGAKTIAEALQATGDPVLALRQLSATMPRAIVEREAWSAFGDDAFKLLQQVY